MRVEGTYTFPGAIERVFAALTDPDALARSIPGCERFIQFGPANEAGEATYETRLRVGQRLAPYTVTARVAGTRRPDYLRLALRGYGPSGAISGEGSLDLVAQDDYTVVAYRLLLSGPDVPEGSDEAQQVALYMARTTCAHLADEIYAEIEQEPVWLPGGMAARGSQLMDKASGKPDALVARVWAQRALWMGVGLTVGLGAIVLALGAGRWLSGHTTEERHAGSGD